MNYLIIGIQKLKFSNPISIVKINELITMYSTSDFKKGLKIMVKGEPHVILDFQHIKPGKGNQFTRTKLVNLLTGVNIDITIRSGEKFVVPDIDYKTLSYVYKDSDFFLFYGYKNL